MEIPKWLRRSKPIASYLPKHIESWEEMYLGKDVKTFVPETEEQARAIVKRASIASMDLHSLNEFSQLRLKWMTQKGADLKAETEDLQRQIDEAKSDKPREESTSGAGTS